MEEDKEQYDEETVHNRDLPNRPPKVRDLFTDRIVGIISGAFVPLVLLLVPIANKYLDNTKEIQTLQIQNNTEDIEITKNKVNVLTDALIASQMQLRTMMEKITSLSKNLDDCQVHLKKQE
jgi:hypothetical protein